MPSISNASRPASSTAARMASSASDSGVRPEFLLNGAYPTPATAVRSRSARSPSSSANGPAPAQRRDVVGRVSDPAEDLVGVLAQPRRRPERLGAPVDAHGRADQPDRLSGGSARLGHVLVGLDLDVV